MAARTCTTSEVSGDVGGSGGATVAEPVHRLGHRTPTVAMRYQHATAERTKRLQGGSARCTWLRAISPTARDGGNGDSKVALRRVGVFAKEQIDPVDHYQGPITRQVLKMPMRRIIALIGSRRSLLDLSPAQ